MITWSAEIVRMARKISIEEWLGITKSQKKEVYQTIFTDTKPMKMLRMMQNNSYGVTRLVVKFIVLGIVQMSILIFQNMKIVPRKGEEIRENEI